MSDGPRREDALPLTIIALCLGAACLLGWSAYDRVTVSSAEETPWAIEAGMSIATTPPSP
jgi:hypothetical protein